jgi:hypothetical protein
MEEKTVIRRLSEDLLPDEIYNFGEIGKIYMFDVPESYKYRGDNYCFYEFYDDLDYIVKGIPGASYRIVEITTPRYCLFNKMAADIVENILKGWHYRADFDTHYKACVRTVSIHLYRWRYVRFWTKGRIFDVEQYLSKCETVMWVTQQRKGVKMLHPDPTLQFIIDAVTMAAYEKRNRPNEFLQIGCCDFCHSHLTPELEPRVHEWEGIRGIVFYCSKKCLLKHFTFADI